ncbi:helix-turn-helix transcriptional regulator [Schaalia hyovaginalis]|uniref:helix-turn-helix domain-containing protein n=1 Tax=Schaalia hyovaginalis TaxID=29316 RepID=UPI002A766556|nr:helix-turn-helix transcriptional regulator [Schaalia hyovaginalis]MDY2669799.1 helix-turn-helix transcriptional regulator [Schaalia hyovaginalis]
MGKQLSATEIAERERQGATVRILREIRGLKAAELANDIGISDVHLYNIESGAKQITPVLVAKIAEALAVPQIAIVRDGYFNREKAEALAEARKLERYIEKLSASASQLQDQVEAIQKDLTDLLARAKAVA